MSSSPKLTVALPQSGNANWVAGPIYTLNLAKALWEVRNETSVFPLLLEQGYRSSLTKWTDGSDMKRHRYSHIESASECPLKRIGKKWISRIHQPKVKSLEKILAAEKCNLLFPASANHARLDCKLVHWIPDFQHLCFPEFFPGKNLVHRTKYLDNIMTNAEHIILSSQTAKADGLKHRPQFADKYKVMPFTMLEDACWFPSDPDSIAAPYSKGREYLVFPSKLWAHKDHETLIHSLAILRDRGMGDLLLICPGGLKDSRNRKHLNKLRRLIRSHKVDDMIHFPGLLPRSTQVQILRAAKAVVQPSRFEGWSALLEEVHLLGKTAFASDIPVHLEQNVPGTFYFPVGDAGALADLIQHHWDRLPPGYDAVSELAGRQRQKIRSHDFGHRFAKIAREIAG